MLAFVRNYVSVLLRIFRSVRSSQSPIVFLLTCNIFRRSNAIKRTRILFMSSYTRRYTHRILTNHYTLYRMDLPTTKMFSYLFTPSADTCYIHIRTEHYNAFDWLILLLTDRKKEKQKKTPTFTKKVKHRLQKKEEGKNRVTCTVYTPSKCFPFKTINSSANSCFPKRGKAGAEKHEFNIRAKINRRFEGSWRGRSLKNVSSPSAARLFDFLKKSGSI